MVDLTENGRRVIEALLKAPLAWQSPEQLASAMGFGVEETTDVLADLDASGWLTAWERRFDVVVTLSVEAAAKLGVRLVESGRGEDPRWAALGDPEPPMPRASGVFRDERAASLERVVDPSPMPDEAVERAEEAIERSEASADARRRAFLESLPAPTLLIGLGLSPWPGPGDGRKASCPACGSKRLKPSMYCLYCDRWGLDHLIRDEPPPRARAPRPAKELARLQELERQSRKAKRKARRTAQAAGKRRPGRAVS